MNEYDWLTAMATNQGPPATDPDPDGGSRLDPTAVRARRAGVPATNAASSRGPGEDPFLLRLFHQEAAAAVWPWRSCTERGV